MRKLKMLQMEALKICKQHLHEWRWSLNETCYSIYLCLWKIFWQSTNLDLSFRWGGFQLIQNPTKKELKKCYEILIWKNTHLPLFSLICDCGKQNTRGNVSKISVSLTCYRHIGSKFINHSRLAWRREGRKVTLVVVIGGFRSALSITRKADGNFGNVSAGVLFSKVAYQRKWW